MQLGQDFKWWLGIQLDINNKNYPIVEYEYILLYLQ